MMDQVMGFGNCGKNGGCKYHGGMSGSGKRQRRRKEDVPLRNGSDDKRVRAADRQDRPLIGCCTSVDSNQLCDGHTLLQSRHM